MSQGRPALLRLLARFFAGGLLAAACAAQAQPLRDYEAGPADSPCRIREAPALESSRFLWIGRCLNGYAQGEGTLRVRRPDAVSVEKGEFRAGTRQGLWEIYSRVIAGDSEITNFLKQYEDGAPTKGTGVDTSVRAVKPRDVPGWAEVLTRISYADSVPARAAAPAAPAAPKAPAKPKPAAAAAAPVAAAALPALSPGYKGHLYVVRFDISDANGTAGDFMSYVAPDRASAQRLYDEYVGGRNSLTQKGQPTLVSLDECDGRGAGPYFALAVVHDARDRTGGGGGWICGAASPDAAARAALDACKTAGGAPCRPRPEAHMYLLVSTHATGGSTQVREVGTFGAASGPSTRVWNNYDYTGCLWASGKLDAEGGGLASALRLDCRSYF